MHDYLLPALFALFMWWFSTGLIIFLDGLPRRTFRWSLAGATVLLALSLYGLAVSSRVATPAAAYWAFACGLFAWGWQEISFYMGLVTGPRREPCPEACAGWRHFLHAIETSLWHELAIIVAAAAVAALTWGAPNKVGLWTFMILWWMHQSAKLNVFLGVRNLNEEFIPEHLAFLKSFLTKRPMNLLFPVSVTASTAIAVLLARNAVSAGADAFRAISLTLLATMMVLAILEHWFLVIPLPAGKLWQWGLASRRPSQSFDATLVVGFLGAGKTTLMRRLLAEADSAVRTVVLVNDFAAAGIDGSLLNGQGADVIELPNGCICCSLRGDLERQIAEMIARWAPRKVLIEPSGVADVAALVGVLHGPSLRLLIQRLSVLGVIDAGSFLSDFAKMPDYFAAQARLAERIIVNKCDLVRPAELRTIRQTLHELNPEVALVPASFGIERPEPLQVAAARAEHDGHAQPAVYDGQHHHGHDHNHHHDHTHPLPELTSWSAPLDGACRADDLEDLLAAIARGDFGAVARVKGLARVGAGWVRFDVAGGRSRMTAFAASDGEEPRVVAIGRDVNEAGLSAAFAACALAEAA